MNPYPDVEGGMTLGELAKGIGLRLLKTATVCESYGWGSPGGARPYLRADSLEAAAFRDFIDWTRGDQDAGGRLRALAHQIGLSPADLQRSAFGKGQS